MTREKLLAVAREIFITLGYERATLAGIAARLGVTAAALLRHVPSKQALFDEAMASGYEVPPFIGQLDGIAATADPREVLRRIAEGFIPFAMRKMEENITLYLHSRPNTRGLISSFDTDRPDSPPKRGLKIVERYFDRAAKAGVMRIRDPRAATLIFMGSLQSYALMHLILKVQPKPFPVDLYIDTLLDVWTEGAIAPAAETPKKRGGSTRGKEKKSR